MRVILVTSATALLLTTIYYFTYEYYSFRQTTKSHLSTLGRIIAENSTAALAFDDKKTAEEVLNALKAEPHIVAAGVFGNNGHLFVKYPKDLSIDNFPPGKLLKGYRFTNSFLEGYEPIVQGDKQLGVLYLKSDMNAIYARFRLYGLFAFIVISLSFILSFLLSRALQKTITKPILDLASTAELISDKGDYAVRAHKSSGQEVSVLTEAFNHMLDQIEDQNKEIRSFNQQLGQRVKERTTELEQANDFLLQQNEFVKTIIDSSVDLISVLDSDLNYVVLNKGALMAYNVASEDIVGKNILDMYPQVETSGIMEDLKKVLKGETVYHSDYTSPVLTRRFENFYIPLKDKDGSVYRILMMGHDITNILDAKESLQAMNAELERSNKSLEQFAYIASHDLQEPLRKIQTFSELTEKNIQNPEEVIRYLGKINSSASRMSDLVKAILNYSRLSQTEDDFVDIDLNNVVENIKGDLELIISEKKAVIQNGKLPVIKGIPLQINQLFLNLISNSLKFNEAIPHILIFSDIVRGYDRDMPEKNGNGSYAELKFRDNGIGFDQQYADRIFTIFQRLHNTKEYAGTGIGLALCKKIVENHHGKITVESMPGNGTTFIVLLPTGKV